MLMLQPVKFNKISFKTRSDVALYSAKLSKRRIFMCSRFRLVFSTVIRAEIVIFVFINIIVKNQRLRALPYTYRLCFAHSCVLTLAASFGLRPNPPKALPLESAKGFETLWKPQYVACSENSTNFLAKKICVACVLLVEIVAAN